MRQLCFPSLGKDAVLAAVVGELQVMFIGFKKVISRSGQDILLGHRLVRKQLADIRSMCYNSFWMEKGLLFQQRKPRTHSYNRVSRKGKQGRTGTQRAISAELILESSLGVCVVRHIGFCLAWWIANWLLCSKARQLKELRWDIYIRLKIPSYFLSLGVFQLWNRSDSGKSNGTGHGVSAALACCWTQYLA